jgi:hypothetical protein
VGLSLLSDYLLDLSVFERSDALGLANESPSQIDHRFCDHFEIVVK